MPNITPDKDTGLKWSEEEIAEYLGSGNKPDGDVAGGLMGEVIRAPPAATRTSPRRTGSPSPGT